MLRSPFSPVSRALCFNFRTKSLISGKISNRKQMDSGNLSLIQKRKLAHSRLINVSGFKTDLLEIRSQEPTLHILFIPGNPGVVSFYTEFLESLYELLGGTASISAVGHISHSAKDSVSGRLFSLQEQIDHKINFIEQELQDVDVPIVLVGHSIGSYISIEIFRRFQEKVIYCICLYPFLAVDTASSTQSMIKNIAASSVLSSILGYLGALVGMLPAQISRFLVKRSIGKSWSSSAIEVLCYQVLQYHTIRNMLFMAITEFQKLIEKPDWDFIRGKKGQFAFLFGTDDHWGPLHLYEEIRNQVPGAHLDLELENHTHAFSCTEAGSIWAARHASSLIKNCVNSADILLA